MKETFNNICPFQPHGFVDFLRWKFIERPPVPGPYEPPRAHTRDHSWLRYQNSVTWIGHSSFLLRFKGKTLLIDPVFSNYCSPIPVSRLRRRSPPGIALDSVLDVDLVLITHNHYDHLDGWTIKKLPKKTHFVVPQELASWFRKRGRSNVHELNWWQSLGYANFRLHCVPAQHFSARTPWDRNKTLWCGWVLESEQKTAYITGDTGYCAVFREIGERFGPTDLSMIPIGAYEPRWFMRPVHVNPEEAVQIHLDVRSRLSVASHWGTFCLTDEPMGEPPQRLHAALQAANVSPDAFRVLSIGETLEF